MKTPKSDAQFRKMLKTAQDNLERFCRKAMNREPSAVYFDGGEAGGFAVIVVPHFLYPAFAAVLTSLAGKPELTPVISSDPMPPSRN